MSFFAFKKHTLQHGSSPFLLRNSIGLQEDKGKPDTVGPITKTGAEED